MPSPPRDRRVHLARSRRAQLADLVAEQCGGDRRLAGLAGEECLDETLRLLVLHLRRHRRFVRVHGDIHEGGPGMGEGFGESRLEIAGLVDSGAKAAACLGPRGEVSTGPEADAELRVAENDLLPEDLPENGVVVDDHLDGEVVATSRGELGHEHREAAIAHERHDLAAGMCPLGGDGVRQAGRHRGEVAREKELSLVADREATSRPGAMLPESHVMMASLVGQLVDDGHEVLRLDRVGVDVGDALHAFVPLAHALLGRLEERAVAVTCQQRDECRPGSPWRPRRAAPPSAGGCRRAPGPLRSGRRWPGRARVGTSCTGSSCRP